MWARSSAGRAFDSHSKGQWFETIRAHHWTTNKMIKNLFSQILDFIETIALAFIIFIVIDAFVAQPHIVRGGSMLPNFHTGERIFTQSVGYRFKPPQRGDVIVFRYPLAPANDFIKRVVGLPGEEISLNGEKIIIKNSQYPGGFILSESYLPAGPATGGKKFLTEGVLYKIPLENIMVFGDNRKDSSDSREWGPVPIKNIVGKVFLRYWPPQALGLISGAVYK